MGGGGEAFGVNDKNVDTRDDEVFVDPLEVEMIAEESKLGTVRTVGMDEPSFSAENVTSGEVDTTDLILCLTGLNIFLLEAP